MEDKNILKIAAAALIDMDGVLYDSMPGHTLAWKRMMDDLGVECTREEFYLYEGMTGVATINHLFRRAFNEECDDERSKELYAIKSRYFKDMGPARLMPGADRMLRALSRAGLSRVLVTGSGQASLLESLDRDYPGMFGKNMRVTAHDVTKGKPHPEPYLRGAAKAGYSPQNCIVIENAPLGVRAGKAAGCFTIAVTTGPIPREAFEKEGADMIFASMEEFADYLEQKLELLLNSNDDSVLVEYDAFAAVELRKYLATQEYDKVLLLTDCNVWKYNSIKFGFIEDVHIVESGEHSKDIATASEVWRWLSESGATRKSILVNLGGGVVTDLGGFCAATFKRGIRFINVPTTLLGAVDASIGGKTGIDLDTLKNEVGAFAMPLKTIVSHEFLETLPKKELISGLAELVKTLIISNDVLYRSLLKGHSLEDSANLDGYIQYASKEKERIVANDPKEQGLRRILNFGHTAGHAYESLAVQLGCPISHGEAVAHGMLVALKLSRLLTGLEAEDLEEYREDILERYYKPLPFNVEEHIEALIELMGHDKKNCGGDEIRFVLLKQIGVPIESVGVSREQLRMVMKEC